jgi:hypothetical protein
LKQQKKNYFEAKAGIGKKSLALISLFEEINPFKRQLKPEKTASSKKRKAESILSTEINFTTSSVEGENKEYLFNSSKPFRSSKTKLAISSHPTTELVVSLIVNIKKQIYSSWEFHVDDRSESSSTYDMIMGRDLLGESVRHNHELQ